jgi:hypothetical protein
METTAKLHLFRDDKKLLKSDQTWTITIVSNKTMFCLVIGREQLNAAGNMESLELKTPTQKILQYFSNPKRKRGIN